jgi:hypothetical protein
VLGCALGPSGAQAVVGGRPYDIRQAPWTVFVEIHDMGYCSGSIIDASHVVTAAHCVFDEDGRPVAPAIVTVSAGVSNAKSPLATDAQQERDVVSYRAHTSYRPSGTGSADDVAVLTLSEPLALDGVTAAAISLPSTPRPKAGTRVALAGFGRTDVNEPSELTLNGQTLTMRDPLACPSGVDPGEADLVCATGTTATPCFGDSGTALYLPTQPPVLVGVADFGESDFCLPGEKGWYANVGAPEILEFIRGDDDPPAAPTFRQGPTLSWSSLRVGGRLVCRAGRWTGRPGYLLTLLTEKGAVRRRGASASLSYVLRKADVGHSLRCSVSATNPGGTGVAEVGPTGPIRSRRTLRG